MNADPLHLTPYSTQLLFSAPEALEQQQWCELLSVFLKDLAFRCDSQLTPSVIGHIKCLALFGKKHYLKASIVSADHPVDLDGTLPGRIQEMQITLNILVYGLNLSLIETLLSAAIIHIQNVSEPPVKVSKILVYLKG